MLYGGSRRALGGATIELQFGDGGVRFVAPLHIFSHSVQKIARAVVTTDAVG